MQDTNNLRDSVKNWLLIDNEIKQLQKEIRVNLRDVYRISL